MFAVVCFHASSVTAHQPFITVLLLPALTSMSARHTLYLPSIFDHESRHPLITLTNTFIHRVDESHLATPSEAATAPSNPKTPPRRFTPRLYSKKFRKTKPGTRASIWIKNPGVMRNVTELLFQRVWGKEHDEQYAYSCYFSGL